MTVAKCDQRIASLFTEGSHNRNISILYLTQNVHPQGKACRDIALNTQYLVLFINLIDRQQVATLARRIYPAFMRKFEDAMARPFSYFVVDFKLGTSVQDRLQTYIFVDQQTPDEENMSDDEGANSVESLDYISSISPPGKGRDESYKQDMWNRRIESLDYKSDLSPPGKRRKLRSKHSKPDIWNKTFQNPIRQEKVEQFKVKVNDYEERGYNSDKAIHLTANDDLPYLC